MKLRELREDDLTALFRDAFGPPDAGEIWTGDDAAVVSVGDRIVFTTDLLTEHVDFELSWATGEDLGHKLVAINVSDVAAMGAVPSKALATASVVVDMELELMEGIVAGMRAAADRWDLDIVGGDLGRAGELSLSLSLIGELPGGAVLRSTARPGDAICVTGAFGGAAAGLMALRAGAVDRKIVDAEIAQPTGADALATLAVRQLRPSARLDESRVIASHATAMIDVSDGLVVDLGRLLAASGVGCEIAASAVPVDPDIAPAMERLPEPVEPAHLALTGGEDFELLFTVDPDGLEDVQMSLDEIGAIATLIGRTTEGDRKIDGEPLGTWMEGTWDHLQNR